MKYSLALCLVALCAYQLVAVQASPNPRQKRWVGQGQCPESATTVEECIDYVYKDGKGCSKVGTDGKFFDIIGCGVVSCVVDGKEIQPTEDLTKPYPDCCPKC